MKQSPFWGLVCALMLSACATIQEQASLEPDQWRTDAAFFEAAQSEWQTRSSWRFNGRVSVKTQELREQASIDWRHSDQANQIRLFGPLGAGAIKIDFDDYGVVLSDNKGVVHRGVSAQTLLTKIVGWPIPVDALQWWLLGQPDPKVPFRYQLDLDGRIGVLEQQGWQIIYSDYREYNSQRMPRKITAQQVAYTDARPVTVRLVTRAWEW